MIRRVGAQPRRVVLQTEHGGSSDAICYQFRLERRFERAQPIYKVFMGRFLEAWYQLSKEEQINLIAKLNA